MGRAIDMENDIHKLKQQVEKLQNTVRGMVAKLDSLDEKSSKTHKVDLVEEVGVEIEDRKEDENESKKTNDEGNDKSSVKSDKRSSKSKKSSDKS
tara:strand:- start:13473 stop:13757 length:285 start_codon:yes stop_codon:yes gene_type:complete